MNNLSELQILIGLGIAILTLLGLFRTQILKPIRNQISKAKLDIIECRLNDTVLDVLLQNNSEKSIIVSSVQLELNQFIFKDQAGPDFLSLEPSEEIYFSIESYTKSKVKEVSNIIKPNEGERFMIRLLLVSGEIRISQFRLHFYSGKKKSASTDYFIDFWCGFIDEYLDKALSIKENIELIKKSKKLKGLQSLSYKNILKRID